MDNPEFRTNLEKQADALAHAGASLYQWHRWLCHPNRDCQDGCYVLPIPARARVYGARPEDLRCTGCGTVLASPVWDEARAYCKGCALAKGVPEAVASQQS